MANSKSIAQKEIILNIINTAQTLVEPIENFKGNISFSAIAVQLFLDLSTGLNLAKKPETMIDIVSSAGDVKAIPLQFYKDLGRISLLKLNENIITFPFDKDAKLSDNDVYIFIEQLEPIFGQALLPVLHTLQQGLQSDIVHVIDNLQSIEPNIIKHSPGGNNELEVSIFNQVDRVTITLATSYRLVKENTITNDIFPYGMIAVHREIILLRTTKENQLKEIQLPGVVIKDHYFPFVEI